MATVDDLKRIIAQTLSPDGTQRKQAEANLLRAQQMPNHARLVLELVATSGAPQEAPMRQAAAVRFKNVVLKGWKIPTVDDEDKTEGIRISAEERDIIKKHLVQLMCTTPPQIQTLLSASIAIIAETDYFDEWTDLLPSLVQQFAHTDISVVIGVLKTADTIFLSFRNAMRSDPLYAKIKYTLAIVAAPLTALLAQVGQSVADPQIINDKSRLVPCVEALTLICSIFYSLNWQDLPEYFEDNMRPWMEAFALYLQAGILQILEDPGEEDQASPMDDLQTQIIQNLGHYADKDEDDFVKDYLPNFTSLVWGRLITLTDKPKHDGLTNMSIRFLTSLVQKPMHTNLFRSEGVLQQMVEKIVIPNLTFREADQVKFEEDPHEYMVTEVEGSDSESRRRCAQDLLRAMCRQLEESTTTICKGHAHTLLTEYKTNPNDKWASKDAAIHLMISVAIRRENMTGVAEINSAVNLIDFFTAHILPELQDANHQHRPVVKVAAIKFVSTFRKQFTQQQCVQLLPLLIAHLSSPIVVVHTFAAYTIERMMMTRDEETSRAKIGAAELTPLLEPLFTGLFTIVDNADLNENAYVMKCVMRTLTTVRRNVAPVTEVVIRHLTAALERVCGNPRSPDFNHYLFESLAILVKSICSQDAASVHVFESFLIAPFWSILEKDISEFTPYVYQILAQLLEFRPPGQGLTDFYKRLFSILRMPENWDNRGNIPALTRLVSAYIAKASTELASHQTAILGIFQKLLAAKQTEAQSVQILNTFVAHFDSATVVQFLPEIFRLLVTRLQKSQTEKYSGLFSSFLGLLASKYGGPAVYQHLESLQNGMAATVADKFWAVSIKSRPPVQRMDAKVQAIGLTHFLFQPLQNGYFLDVNAAVWTKMVLAGVALLSSPSFAAKAVTAGLDDADIVDVSYDSTFSELKFSRTAPVDLFPDHPNPAAEFCQGLMQLSQQRPGHIAPMLQQGAQGDPKTLQHLQILLDAHQVQIA